MMHRKPVTRVVSKFLIPFILLFALYVQWHGDFGPGGGFQAGVVFGAAFILYAILFGVGIGRRVIPAWVTRLILSLGVLLYAGTGVAGMLLGGEFLNYNVLAHDPQHGQHYGILLVEAAIGLTVATVMIAIFARFASWGLRR
jgi:multicomponent Na+:H+ antiporter subunit B